MVIVNHWKYIMGTVIVYRDVYRASSDAIPFSKEVGHSGLPERCALQYCWE
jgi:hypothetical protein